MTSPLQQKLKINGPVVVTANRLGDGAVVYRTAGRRLDDRSRRRGGRHAPRRPRTSCSQRAHADELDAVGAYVAPVELDAGQRVLPGQSARAHPARQARPSRCRAKAH